MKEDTTEFRVTVEGPPLAVDQFEHLLNKLKGEGERSGVDVTVERVNTERTNPAKETLERNSSAEELFDRGD